MTAPIRDMAGLVRACRDAVEERQVTCENVDDVGGLAIRSTTKCLAENYDRRIGPASFMGIMGALGKCLVMVDDPEQIARVKHRWIRRKRVTSLAAAQAARSSIDAAVHELLQFKAKLALSERMKTLGKIGGKKGGKRRAKVMGKRARQAQASHAARKRWAKEKRG